MRKDQSGQHGGGVVIDAAGKAIAALVPAAGPSDRLFGGGGNGPSAGSQSPAVRVAIPTAGTGAEVTKKTRGDHPPGQQQ